MQFAILHTIAFLMVALTIIPQNSVAPIHDRQEITQILESVKFIDDYTNKFHTPKHTDDRDKQKVYKLSIEELREKIKEAHPEYKDNEHTLADKIQQKIEKMPTGMHAIGQPCYWATILKELNDGFKQQLSVIISTFGSSFEVRLRNKKADALSKKQNEQAREAHEHIDSANTKLGAWIRNCRR